MPASTRSTALKEGWDLHIGFGLANPALFRLLHSALRTPDGRAAVEEGESIFHGRIHRVAAAGRLRVTERRAADLIRATATGVIFTLIDEPADRAGRRPARGGVGGGRRRDPRRPSGGGGGPGRGRRHAAGRAARSALLVRGAGAARRVAGAGHRARPVTPFCPQENHWLVGGRMREGEYMSVDELTMRGGAPPSMTRSSSGCCGSGSSSSAAR